MLNLANARNNQEERLDEGEGLQAGAAERRVLRQLAISFFLFGLINNGAPLFPYKLNGFLLSYHSPLRDRVVCCTGPCSTVNTEGPSGVL